jgi:hypothetical protein
MDRCEPSFPLQLRLASSCLSSLVDALLETAGSMNCLEFQYPALAFSLRMIGTYEWYWYFRRHRVPVRVFCPTTVLE